MHFRYWRETDPGARQAMSGLGGLTDIHRAHCIERPVFIVIAASLLAAMMLVALLDGGELSGANVAFNGSHASSFLKPNWLLWNQLLCRHW